MDISLAVALLAGAVGIALIVSLFMRLTGKRDWGSPFNPKGFLGGWTPPEVPEDEWEKWKDN
jgi:hypothetical protein